MYQLETGAMSPDGYDGAFLWLYCRDGRSYAKYMPEGQADVRIPMAFALLRWDGTFGTIGGKVDPGESLRTALAREALEEANFSLPQDVEVEALGTFKYDSWHIHSFCLELSYTDLLSVRAKASAFAHASPEVAGFNIVPAVNYRPASDSEPRGVEAFLQNRFCGTARLEFDALLAKLEGS